MEAVVINKWTKTPKGNEILESNEGERLLISFRDFVKNPAPFYNVPFFAPDNHNKLETAMKFMGEWYVLNGDFRKAYEKAFPDSVQCFKVYQDNIEKRSTWSTDTRDSSDVLEWFKARCQY